MAVVTAVHNHWACLRISNADRFCNACRIMRVDCAVPVNVNRIALARPYASTAHGPSEIAGTRGPILKNCTRLAIWWRHHVQWVPWACVGAFCRPLLNFAPRGPLAYVSVHWSRGTEVPRLLNGESHNSCAYDVDRSTRISLVRSKLGTDRLGESVAQAGSARCRCSVWSLQAVYKDHIWNIGPDCRHGQWVTWTYLRPLWWLLADIAPRSTGIRSLHMGLGAFSRSSLIFMKGFSSEKTFGSLLVLRD